MVDGLAGGSNRTRAMELTSFFDAIVDDAEKIFLAGDWPKIPDIYSVPKEYGYADAKEKRPGLS